MSKLKNTYQRTYKLRIAQGGRKNSYEVTFPYDVVNKEARKLGLKPHEFISQCYVTAFYNGFDGVLYKFTTSSKKICISLSPRHSEAVK